MDGGITLPRATLSVVAYEPKHLREIALQPHQAHLAPHIQAGWAEKVEAAGPCWTAIAGGRPICCAGFIEHWPGRAGVWAILSEDAGRHMVSLTRRVRALLDAHPAERIEAQAEVGVKAAERWVSILGFEPEATLRNFYRGADYRAFVRLRLTL